MKKYFLIQCYNCDKRRRLMFMVQDVITGETFHLTESEWYERQNDVYSPQESEAFHNELRSRSYLKEVERSKKGRKK